MLASLIIILLLSGCAPTSDTGGPPYSVDLLPPLLIAARTVNEYSVEFTFDEAVDPVAENLMIVPGLPVESIDSDGSRIRLVFSEAQTVGGLYVLRMAARDSVGNTLGFVYEFSGWNPSIPEILINELNPRGSGNTPDCIEIIAVSSGNLGGLWLTVGTEGDYSESFIFPALEIVAGDYLLMHTRSEGLPEEIDETDSIDISGGLLASANARDFWLPGSPGLPGNNGAVTIYNRKGGEIIDAVIWSDRITEPDDEKLGWTNAGFAFAEDLGVAGGWLSTAGDTPGPSDAVDVSSSTATRSLCRLSVPEDSNSDSDWHTVPTRGQTFGEINTDEIHIP